MEYIVVKYWYPNVLGDFRDVEINFTLWSTVEKAKQWKLLGASRNVKVAALFDKLEHDNIMCINKLFSHVFKVSVFTDYDKTIEWLMSKLEIFLKRLF